MNHQGISVPFYCVFNSRGFGVLHWRKDFFLSLFAHITKLSSPAGTKSLSAFWSMRPAVSGKSYDPEAYWPSAIEADNIFDTRVINERVFSYF